MSQEDEVDISGGDEEIDEELQKQIEKEVEEQMRKEMEEGMKEEGDDISDDNDDVKEEIKEEVKEEVEEVKEEEKEEVKSDLNEEELGLLEDDKVDEVTETKEPVVSREPVVESNNYTRSESKDDIEIDSENLELTVKRLKKKVEDLKSQVREEAELRRQAERKVRNNEMRESIKQTGAVDFQQQITQASEDIRKTMEREFDTKLRIATDNLKGEHKRALQLLREEVNEAQKSAVRAKDEKDRLARDVRRMETENEDLREERRDAENLAKDLETQIKEMRREHADQQSNKAGVQRNYNNLKIEYDNVNQKYKDLVSKSTTNNQRLRELETKFNEMQSTNDEEKRLRIKAEKENDRLQMQIESLKEQVQDETDSRNLVEDELNSANLKITELRTQKRISDKTVDRLERARENHEREIQSLRTQLQEERSRGQYQSVNVKRTLEGRIKELTRELDSELETKAELNRQKRALKRENKRLAFKLESLARDKNRTTSRFERTKVSAEAGSEQTRILQLKVDDLNKKNALLEKRLSHTTLMKDDAVRDKEKFERVISRLEEEIEQYKEQLGEGAVFKPKKVEPVKDEEIETVTLPSEKEKKEEKPQVDDEVVEPIKETAEDIVEEIKETVDDVVENNEEVVDNNEENEIDEIDDEALEEQIQKELEEELANDN